MHFLLIPVGSHGDVHPFVGLGIKLKQRGHDVTLATNGHFGGLVKKAGLEFVETSSEEQYQREIRTPDIWHPIKGVKLLMRLMARYTIRTIYDYTIKLARPGTVACTAPLALGARVAHEKHGIPLATIDLQPIIFRSTTLPPVYFHPGFPSWTPALFHRFHLYIADRFVIDPELCPELDKLRDELGLPRVRRIFGDYWHSPQLSLGMFPDWFGPPQPDWPKQVRLAGFPMYDEKGATELPEGLEEFLQAGTPPVVFTPGSAMVQGADFFKQAAEACRISGRRGILLTRFAEQIPAQLPEGVRHYSYIPLSQVLHRAAALVYHGGIGTCSQALAAGIPHLVMPMSYDQPDNAARLKRLGVGGIVTPQQFKAKRVAAELKRLIDTPSVHENAKRYAEKLKGDDALARACEYLEQLKPA